MRRDCNQGCFSGTQASREGRPAAWSCPWCCPSERLGVRTDRISSKCIHWTRGPGKAAVPGPDVRETGAGSIWRLGSSLLAWQLPGLTPRGLLAGQALEKDSGSRVYLWERDSTYFTGSPWSSPPSYVYSQQFLHPRHWEVWDPVTSSEQAPPPTETWEGPGRRSPEPAAEPTLWCCHYSTGMLLCMRFYFCLFYFCSIRQSPRNRRMLI